MTVHLHIKDNKYISTVKKLHPWYENVTENQLVDFNIKVTWRSWWRYITQRLIVAHIYTKYHKSMSKDKKRLHPDTKMPPKINLTLRSMVTWRSRSRFLCRSTSFFFAKAVGRELCIRKSGDLPYNSGSAHFHVLWLSDFYFLSETLI